MPKINGPYSARTVRGQFVNRNKLEYGIYDNEWRRLPNSGITGSQLTTVPFSDYFSAPQVEDSVTGPTLFAGFAPEQFGHAILNSLGHLWALEHLPTNTKLYYISKKRPLKSKFTGPLLNAFGIENVIITSNVQLRFEEIYTATNLFDERFNSTTKGNFQDWLTRRLPPEPAILNSKSVYVTRSKLGPQYGRFACEENLEILLARNGFEIFSPEQHNLPEQLETYRTAKTLVFSESSSLHLYALVRRRDQNTIVINRRENIPKLISQQLEFFEENPVKYINVIKDSYWPPVRADSRSLSVLDFDKLKDKLVEAGAINSRVSWNSPSHQDIQKSLRKGLKVSEVLYDKKSRPEFLKNYKSRKKTYLRQKI